MKEHSGRISIREMMWSNFWSRERDVWEKKARGREPTWQISSRINTKSVSLNKVNGKRDQRKNIQAHLRNILETKSIEQGNQGSQVSSLPPWFWLKWFSEWVSHQAISYLSAYCISGSMLNSALYVKLLILKELYSAGTNSQIQEWKLGEIKSLDHWKNQNLNPNSPVSRLLTIILP